MSSIYVLILVFRTESVMTDIIVNSRTAMANISLGIIVRYLLCKLLCKKQMFYNTDTNLIQ